MKTSRIVLLAFAALIGLGLLAGAIYAESRRPQLELGVGYAARVACACRHIGNRPLESCYADFEPGMEIIRLIEDAAAKSVTASVPLLARRTATFDPLLGCQPDAFIGKAIAVSKSVDQAR